MADGPEWLTVPSEASGLTLAGWLGLQRADAFALIQRGGVWVERRRVQDPAFPLIANATIVIHRPPSGIYRSVTILPEQILYEDADLIAINKHPGTYVEMTPWDAEQHVRGALVHFLAARDGTPPTLHLAQRLDRDTSGVLLLTKQSSVNAALYDTFSEGQAHKRYLARCMGDPQHETYTIQTGHGRSRNGLFRTYPHDQIGQVLPDGSRIKHMETDVRVLQRFGDTALIEAHPRTGRTHQIRLHLAQIGHPLLGDLKYGGPQQWRGQMLEGHLLHAARLELAHPRTHQQLVIEAPLPDWAQHT